MRFHLRKAAAASIALALSVAPAAAAGDEPTTRFHADGEAIDAAAHSAARAIWSDDMPAARAAFDRLEKGCRRLMPEEKARFGESIVNADRSYHLALASAREHSGAGDSAATFEDFVGLQTICRGCHLMARDEGRWPDHR